MEERRDLFQIIYMLYLSDKLETDFEFSINYKEKTLKLGDIGFFLGSIEPIILLETFVSKIHEVVKAREGMSVIDAGACFGDTALYFAMKGCKIFAAEPNPTNYKAMLKNISLNPKLRSLIKTYRYAIGIDGRMDIRVNKGIDGTSSIYGIGSSIKTSSYSLGTFMDKCKLKKADILKMDCKGAEDYLLPVELERIGYCAKIEYEAIKYNPEILINKLKKAGFNKIERYRHNLDIKLPIDRHGTVLAFR